MQLLTQNIAQLHAMKKYPQTLYYKGNTQLLEKTMIAVVGSRKPNQYARSLTHQLCSKLSAAGVCIVSGGAIGIDAIAHKAAGCNNTIMVAATGLEKRYPSINKNLIAEIETRGLVLSQFDPQTPSYKYNFVLRNELVVALAGVLVVSYAELHSGTMRSVEFAKKMGKKIYVLPHRLGESDGTNQLLEQGEAEAIFSLESFVEKYAATKNEQMTPDDFIQFCQTNPDYETALKKFGKRLFEAELLGEVTVLQGRVYLS